MVTASVSPEIRISSGSSTMSSSVARTSSSLPPVHFTTSIAFVAFTQQPRSPEARPRHVVRVARSGDPVWATLPPRTTPQLNASYGTNERREMKPTTHVTGHALLTTLLYGLRNESERSEHRHADTHGARAQER